MLASALVTFWPLLLREMKGIRVCVLLDMTHRYLLCGSVIGSVCMCVYICLSGEFGLFVCVSVCVGVWLLAVGYERVLGVKSVCVVGS